METEQQEMAIYAVQVLKNGEVSVKKWRHIRNKRKRITHLQYSRKEIVSLYWQVKNLEVVTTILTTKEEIKQKSEPSQVH
jgi:hypothetical protein